MTDPQNVICFTEMKPLRHQISPKCVHVTLTDVTPELQKIGRSLFPAYLTFCNSGE